MNNLKKGIAAVMVCSSAMLTVGVSSASAANIDATLNFFSGLCDAPLVGLEVSGRFNTQLVPIGVSVDIWGADTFFDDHLVGPVDMAFGWSSGKFDEFLCVPPDTLDEDDGEDEIYIKGTVTVTTGSLSYQSNEISHSF
jgi:hypothetical protein